jgi:hypothetical protein
MSKLASAIEAMQSGVNTVVGKKLDAAEPGHLGTVWAQVMPSPTPAKTESFDVGTVGGWCVPAPDGGEARPSTAKWPPNPEDVQKQAAANIANSSQIQFVKNAVPSLFTKPAKSKGPEVF